MAEVATIIRQLNNARDIVLRDAAIYPQVVPGVLNVIAPSQALELRRCGSDFLAETFASPVVNAEEKQKMCLGVLDNLTGYLNRKEIYGEEEDPSVVKSAVQCSASIYPLVFRHAISQKEDKESWGKMMNIKSSILRRMDTAAPGVRICCIKFVARVVQVQTPGLIADPRRQDKNEISLALVPRDHSFLTPSILEAEASGLLDRLLGVLQENSQDALIVTATLNALSTLVQRRASISTKILSIVATFDPLTLATKAMSGKEKVAVRSMTRTTISFLLNVLKRNPNHPLAGRLQQHGERLKHNLHEAFSEVNHLKRSAPEEPMGEPDETKRQRLQGDAVQVPAAVQQPVPVRLPPGPATYAQLFTLNQEQGSAPFHAEALPLNIVTQLVHALLSSIDQGRLTQAIQAVSSRYLDLEQRVLSRPPGQVRNKADDDDDDAYNPEEFDDDGATQPSPQVDDVELELGPFYLPPSPPLTDHEAEEYSTQALERVFDTLGRYDKEGKKGKVPEGEKGFNRVISAAQDRDGYITLLTRLATRPVFDLIAPDAVKDEANEEDENRITKKGRPADLPTKIRQAFLKYITDNHRRNIGVAISWLNEEWYTDKLSAKQHPSSTRLASLPNYISNLTALLNSMDLFIDKQDLKVLIRFLSEIPALPPCVFSWLKRLADDPERVQIVAGALQYLVMFRPPAREAALDCGEDLWRSNPDAKKPCGKFLRTWRPAVVQDEAAVAGEIKAEL